MTTAPAHDGWSLHGQFALLHQMNEARLSFIHQHLPHGTSNALKNMTILDVGCGVGILSEPLARLGAQVTAIDKNKDAITEARRHAQTQKLTINYERALLDEWRKKNPAPYHLITAMEVIEHVEDPRAFVGDCASLMKEGGVLILSTLNRTWLSYMGAIVGGEYITRLIPYGTHAYRLFITPDEMRALLASAGLSLVGQMGLFFDPLRRDFVLSEHRLRMNYIVAAVKSLR